LAKDRRRKSRKVSADRNMNILATKLITTARLNWTPFALLTRKREQTSSESEFLSFPPRAFPPRDILAFSCSPLEKEIFGKKFSRNNLNRFIGAKGWRI
jgi:hypothetical protein